MYTWIVIYVNSPLGPIAESISIFEGRSDVLNRFHQKNWHVIVSPLKQANIHILKYFFTKVQRGIPLSK